MQGNSRFVKITRKMAASLRNNMTFTSRTLLKWTTLKSKCGKTHLYFVLPKRHLSGLMPNSVKCRPYNIHRHREHWGRILTVRHASTDSSSLPPGYIPDIPLGPVADVKGVLPELNSLGEPTLQSIGLGGYNPSGIVQQLLEMAHVSLDLPWWGSIVICACILRTLMFPLMIYQRKNTVNLRNHTPTITRLSQKATDAKTVGNKAIFNKRTNEMYAYMERNNISYKAMLIMPAIQLPIFLSVYQAIRKMSILPVETMKTGGMLWFTDLTVPDPTYILPACAALSILAMFELGAEAQRTQDMGHVAKWVSRSIPFVVFFLTCKFASGIAFYWSVNNFISLITVLILKQNAVKRCFNIPDDIVHKPSEVKRKKKFIEGFQEAYNNSKLAAELNQRQRIDETTFKNAGVGPVPKTYQYDPTKKKNKKIERLQAGAKQ